VIVPPNGKGEAILRSAIHGGTRHSQVTTGLECLRYRKQQNFYFYISYFKNFKNISIISPNDLAIAG